MSDYTTNDIMAALIDFRDGVARQFEAVDGKIERLQYDMNRRFDRVDERFDLQSERIAALEGRRRENVTTTARLLDLGRRPYREVWDLQRAIHAAVAEDRAPETWIVVEHEPVITLGRNAKRENILHAPDVLASRGVDLVEVERGGDVTYHGPGQVVVYPIRKLPRFREVAPLVSALERAIIAALARFGIAAAGRREHRGVYVGVNAICAIGLAVRRMTSLHGLALNAGTELDYDRLITPCGTPEFGITSISREAGRAVSWSEARDALLPALEAEFGITFVWGATEELAAASLG